MNLQQEEQMSFYFGRTSKFLPPPPQLANLVAPIGQFSDPLFGLPTVEAQFTQPAEVEAHIWVSKI